MLLDMPISRDALFDTDRRDDITVIANKPIADLLGDEAHSLADFLTKGGAAAISLYPTLSVTFRVGRLYGSAKPIARHKYTAPNAVGPLVEMALRDIADQASKFLCGFDPDAFVTVSVTSREAPKRLRTKRARSDFRWWRGF